MKLFIETFYYTVLCDIYIHTVGTITEIKNWCIGYTFRNSFQNKLICRGKLNSHVAERTGS